MSFLLLLVRIHEPICSDAIFMSPYTSAARLWLFPEPSIGSQVYLAQKTQTRLDSLHHHSIPKSHFFPGGNISNFLYCITSGVWILSIHVYLLFSLIWICSTFKLLIIILERDLYHTRTCNVLLHFLDALVFLPLIGVQGDKVFLCSRGYNWSYQLI